MENRLLLEGRSLSRINAQLFELPEHPVVVGAGLCATLFPDALDSNHSGIAINNVARAIRGWRAVTGKRIFTKPVEVGTLVDLQNLGGRCHPFAVARLHTGETCFVVGV